MATDRIVLLDENTANRIAAGEVVERPASAVKELVENAIDAGASQIAIRLEEGGKQQLVVADNGWGMTRADAVLALQRHATSKIRSADDLFAIHTLGFRGEALPSIASVSRLTVTTKPPDEESGTRLQVVGGDIESAEEVAARDGTSIEVADLFFNTPARLKFLKSTPTEMARAIEVVGQLAVAYPGIAFRLRSGSQEVFSTPGTGEPLAALAAVWGRDIARKLIPVRHESPGLAVTGYIATPDASRPGRSHELFFVNRRPIRSRLLGHALEEAFRALTPDSRYPIAALFVEITPDLVDVNVHPTKTEVKFTRDGEVHHAASQAVKSALLAYGIVPTARPAALEPAAPLPSPQGALEWRQEPDRHPLASPGIRPAAATALSPFEPLLEAASSRLAPLPAESSDPFAAVAPEQTSESPETAPLAEPPRPRPFAEQLRDFQVLGQARNTYIIALTDEGLAIIDQHVAHERVLYERLTVKRFSQGIPAQRLTTPITIALSRREALLLAEHCGSFAAAGWEIAPFGRESFVVRAIPAVLTGKPYEQVLRDMIDELVNQTISRRLLVQQDHVTITN
ncbi:MAG TPA: DNA mismatch repair endonuclease MutL, partial [Chthonomonadaceae bacterium]|nr:DNA mismatch repair endonuclease MutL [Chthonomonadaceae bacterium]